MSNKLEDSGMLPITLTPEQKNELETRHKKSRDKRESDRIKAVLLSDEGWQPQLIAQALRIHETTVYQHLKDFIKLEKLTINSGGSKSALDTQQTQELIAHLTATTYLQTHQIVAYVAKQHSVQYTVSGMNKWLHQNHFSYKQPKSVPHKFDAKKQLEFVQAYEQLKSEAKADEPIVFMDAVHPTQATKITSGWIRKGMDKPIETTGSRTRLNIVGAIELGNLSRAVIEQYSMTVNGDSIVDFLQKVKAAYSDKQTIHLILDGAGYHRSAQVKEMAESLNIQLHYLPPYSPNLNPIERLWKVMNKHVRNNQYFSSAKEFRQKIGLFFSETLPNIATSLDSVINDRFQLFKTAL